MKVRAEPRACAHKPPVPRAQQLKLLSSDGQAFDVDAAVALQSKTIRGMVEDTGVEDAGGEDAVPLPNVTGRVLAKVLEYCAFHVREAATAAKRPPSADQWDADFVRQLDQTTLFDLVLAANYLDITPLLDLTCRTVARMITGKTAEDIRTLLNIRNDFSPEEEDEVRMHSRWLFE